MPDPWVDLYLLSWDGIVLHYTKKPIPYPNEPEDAIASTLAEVSAFLHLFNKYNVKRPIFVLKVPL